MSRRTFLAAVAVFSVIVFVALFAVLRVSAQTNSAPQFSAETATRDVGENSPSFHNIGVPVTATGSDDDRLVYTLENARTSPFTIVRATGQLQVGAPLDYETASSYTVKVIATDTSGAKDTITVTITVTNVEEDGKVSLTWTRPQPGTDVKASLTDPDGNVSGVTWQWEKSTNQTDWTDAAGNGATSHTYTPQSGDARKYLRAVASYTDPLGSGKTARSAAAYVKEAPSPNHSPVFQANTGGGYTCKNSEAAVCLHVRRSAAAGSEIYYPSYVDNTGNTDNTDDDQVRYSIEGADSGKFRIGPLSGDLYTTNAHAYNDPGTDGIFKITIFATDPSDNSGSITVALKPSGSAGSPVVKGPERIVYPENGTWPLATYSATTSPDREIRGWIISVEPGGGDGDFFDIDDDGVLTFTQPPDYEDPADESGDYTYSFTIMAYDPNPPSGQRPGETLFGVRVTVADVDEPLEVLGPTAVDYAENGTDAVATYTLHGTSAPVEWSLSGADGGEFSIDANGVLTFNRQPDYENPTDAANENAYLVTITAYVGEQSKTEFVRVRVTDVNEPPKFDAGAAAPRSVDRSASVDQVFGELVKATDPDEDGLTYTLENLQLFPFDIEHHTGQLFVSEALDDAQSSYTVPVSVRDSKDADGNADTSADDRITVTINVTNENEPPEFPSTETGARSFPEDATGVQNVGVPVAATDADDDTLTYTLGGTDASSFQIVSTSGQIQTTSGVTYDHEAKASYSVTVTANDGNGGAADQDVTITVTNLEEPGTVTLSTNQPSARSAVTATLSDPDEGVTGTSWQWQKSSDGGINWTDVGTDSSSYTPTDTDMGSSLRATASYTDGHGQNKSAQATTTQAVRTGSNRAPDFGATDATRSFPENTGPGENIGDPVTATDPDTGNTLTYSLDATGAVSFDIDSTSGQIKTKSGVTYDHETVPTYPVTVTATDNHGDSDTIAVTITVTDANDPPTVTGDSTVSYAENRTDTVATYTASDPEGTSITWSLSGDDAEDFVISEGVLTFGATPNFEDAADANTDNVYLVTVEASDGSVKGTLDVTVTVTGVKEAPEFPATETGARAISENTEAGQPIGDPVEAEDPDVGDSLTYTLSGADAASFDIVTTSGQLQTKAVLDKETRSSYTVTVTASDGSLSDIQEVIITVTDANEPPSVSGQTSVSYEENRTDTVATYTASDPEGTSITWSLSGDDAEDFVINEGVLTFGATPNFEDAADANTDNVYLVTVEASDGSVKGTLDVTVTVTNVNEPPEFPSTETGARSVAENTAAGVNIGLPVSATDPDAGDTLTYTLGGTDAASFDIVTTSGQLQTEAALDHEGKASYEVTVSVRDSKDASGNTDMATDATITATITVTNVNETAGVSVHRDRRSQRGREHPCQPVHRPSCVGHRSGRWRHADLHPGRVRRVLLRHRHHVRAVADRSRPGP